MSIEERLTKLRLWESKAPMEDFLREFDNDPFREYVGYELKRISARALQEGALMSWELAADALGISTNLEIPSRLSGTLKARIMIDPTYWQGDGQRSCAEAFSDIIHAVAQELGWEDENVEALDQHALFNIYEFAVYLFAGLGSESRFIRRSMGIRKGLFG